MQDSAVGVETARLVVSSLTHGVRTPVYSMLGLGELLAMTELDTDQRGLVERIVEAGDSLITSCDRVGLLLRLLAGETAGAVERFELSEVIGEATATAVATPVTVRIHPAIPAVLVGDAEALRYLLAELLTNAAAHGRPPITVTVDVGGPATATDPLLRISVTDGGSGLSPTHLARLNGAPSARPSDPCQIGFYLVQWLAERLGGQLSAAQRAGGGTEVILEMTPQPAPPSASPAPAPAAALRGPQGRTAGRSLRVLLVEDNSVNRILTRKQLTRLGHQLDTVTNGLEAVAAVLAGEYDVVLMDRHLPDLDGVEATRRIRAAEAEGATARRTPIVAVTADAIAGHREECLAAGMDGFLTKPVDLEHLRAALVAFTPPPERHDLPGVEVDLEALDRLTAQVDGDSDTVVEMVQAYLAELPGRRLRLQMAIRRSSTRQTVVAAEALRAASDMIGAIGVARTCADIAAAARKDDFNAGHDALPALLDTCARAVGALGPLAGTGTRSGTGATHAL